MKTTLDSLKCKSAKSETTLSRLHVWFFSFFHLTRKWIRLCQSTVGVATGFNAAIKSVTRCCFPTAACLPCDQATDEAPRARCVFVYQRLVSPMLTEQEVSGALRVQDITQPRLFATVAFSCLLATETHRFQCVGV